MIRARSQTVLLKAYHLLDVRELRPDRDDEQRLVAHVERGLQAVSERRLPVGHVARGARAANF